MKTLKRFWEWIQRTYFDEVAGERHRIEEDARRFNGSVTWND